MADDKNTGERLKLLRNVINDWYSTTARCDPGIFHIRLVQDSFFSSDGVGLQPQPQHERRPTAAAAAAERPTRPQDERPLGLAASLGGDGPVDISASSCLRRRGDIINLWRNIVTKFVAQKKQPLSTELNIKRTRFLFGFVLEQYEG